MVSFKIDQKLLLHFVGDHIEEAPQILMLIVVIHQPSESFVDTDDVVVQVV